MGRTRVGQEGRDGKDKRGEPNPRLDEDKCIHRDCHASNICIAINEPLKCAFGKIKKNNNSAYLGRGKETSLNRSCYILSQA